MGGHGASVPEPLPRKEAKALVGAAIKETGVAMKIVGGEEVSNIVCLDESLSFYPIQNGLNVCCFLFLM